MSVTVIFEPCYATQDFPNVQRSGNSVLKTLPEDILELIFHEFLDGKEYPWFRPTLSDCALISRFFCNLVQKLIFSNVKIRSQPACSRLLLVLEKNPNIASYTTKLSIVDSCFSPSNSHYEYCIFDSAALPKVINIIAAHGQLTSIYVSGSISLRHQTGFSVGRSDFLLRHRRPSRGSIVAIERSSRAVDLNPLAVWVREGAISLLRSLSVPYLVPDPKTQLTLETLELFGCNMTPILEYMKGKWFPFDLTHLKRLVVFCLNEGNVSNVRELIRFPSVQYFVILPPTSRVIHMNLIGYQWQSIYPTDHDPLDLSSLKELRDFCFLLPSLPNLEVITLFLQWLAQTILSGSVKTISAIISTELPETDFAMYLDDALCRMWERHPSLSEVYVYTFSPTEVFPDHLRMQLSRTDATGKLIINALDETRPQYLPSLNLDLKVVSAWTAPVTCCINRVAWTE